IFRCFRWDRNRAEARNSTGPDKAIRGLTISTERKAERPQHENRLHSGHPLTEGNVYIDPRGWAHCKACRRESVCRYRHAHPDRVKEVQKRRRIEHQEYRNAIAGKWNTENPEKSVTKRRSI